MQDVNFKVNIGCLIYLFYSLRENLLFIWKKYMIFAIGLFKVTFLYGSFVFHQCYVFICDLDSESMTAFNNRRQLFYCGVFE